MDSQNGDRLNSFEADIIHEDKVLVRQIARLPVVPHQDSTKPGYLIKCLCPENDFRC